MKFFTNRSFRLPAFALTMLLATAMASPAVAQGKPSDSQRLIDGWKFVKSDLPSAWDVWSTSPRDVVPWQEINLPHCYNALDAVDPDTRYYEGPAWYQDLITVDNPYTHGRTLLHFEGAGQRARVYVYDKLVGSHLGGYDEWDVDITDAVAAFRADKAAAARFKGKIPIAVRCDNSPDNETVPSDRSDFNRYGGLYRYVDLVYAPAVSLERVHFVPTPDGKGGASVVVSARVRNPENLTTPVTVKLQVDGPQGHAGTTFSVTLKPWNGEKTLGTLNLTNVELWSPDDPALYECHVTLDTPDGEQKLDDHFGVRTYTFVDHGPFLLNGSRLLLRGTHRHEDGAGVGAAETEASILKEMKMIKDMGANFIRLAHYQQSSIVLNACDRLGIMVWEEVPWCRGGIGGPSYQKEVKDLLSAMIDQHKNHPAVIIWGMGNENDWPGDFPTFDKDAIRDFTSQLVALSHKLDPTRLTGMRRCDFCKDVVDVYSPSIWAGWYRGKYTEYKTESHRQMEQVKHFLHMEWGGSSVYGRHSENPYKGLSGIKTGQGVDERSGDYLLTGGNPRVSSNGDWSETYFCDLVDWTLKEQETMPWLTGAAQWVFKDFSTPLRPENPIPFMNEKGVVTRDLRPKESYYVFQSYWTTKPMAHIYGHTWPIRWGKNGETKQVKVYSNCPEAELFVNGKSAGVRHRNSQDFPAAGLHWDVVFNDGPNDLKVVATSGATTVTDEIHFTYETRQWGKPANVKLTEIGRKDDVVTIQATEYDDKGVQCLDSRDFIRFGLTGDGKLIDDLGTIDASRYEEFTNGSAVISLHTNDGESVASAAVKGLPTAFLDIHAK